MSSAEPVRAWRVPHIGGIALFCPYCGGVHIHAVAPGRNLPPYARRRTPPCSAAAGREYLLEVVASEPPPAGLAAKAAVVGRSYG